MLAAISHADVSTLFLVLAVVGFAIALYLGYLGNVAGALVVALIAILILLFAA